LDIKTSKMDIKCSVKVPLNWRVLWRRLHQNDSLSCEDSGNQLTP
jgi:hypothetical protein